MTALLLVDGSGIADLSGYLVRLLRYDRAAVVHLRADGAVLGTFGRVPFGGGTSGVLALRTSELAAPDRIEATVSAGRLLDALTKAEADATAAHRAGRPRQADQADHTDQADQASEAGRAESQAGRGQASRTRPDQAPDPTVEVDLPPAVTGPPWTAMLPPRTGWTPKASLPIAALVREVADAVGRFRARTEALPADERTRPVLDRIAEDVWSKALPGVPDTHLPLRAAHAAAALGFLGAVDSGAEATVLAVGGWLRLDAPFGSVSVRRPGGPSLFVPGGR